MTNQTTAASFEASDFPMTPVVKRVIQRLKTSGHEAFVVGGAVRDYCLHRPIKDWDVVTSASPPAIRSVFSDMRSFTLKHETVTLVDQGERYEVTPFRGKEPGIASDLGHRDFTINAMAYDPETGWILDPYNGKKDLARKVVRAVGNPPARFTEDPLRILRAVRLAVQLGFRIEPETHCAVVSMAGDLAGVSPERIRDEFMMILLGKRPSRAIAKLVSTGLMRFIVPELLEGIRKKQNTYHRYTVYRHTMETVDRVAPEPVMRLTALLHDIAKPRVREKVDGGWRFFNHETASADMAAEIMGRLRFSGDLISQVTGLIRHHMIGYRGDWKDGAVRRFIRRVGEDRVGRLLAFRRADLLAHGVPNRESARLEELEKRVKCLQEKPFPKRTRELAIDGNKVMAILGIGPGPEVGEVLRWLMKKVTDHPDRNREAVLTRLLREEWVKEVGS